MINIILDSYDSNEKQLEVREKAKLWATNKEATKKFIELADLYWSMYLECGNVNPVIAYAQAALETNFGEYSDELKESLFNPCGMKIYKDINDDEVEECYASFESWNDGVSAHLDHLALYAGVNGYPKEETNDPKHFSYLYGICKDVEGLTGKWSAAQTYGEEVIKFVNEILDTVNKKNNKKNTLNNIAKQSTKKKINTKIDEKNSDSEINNKNLDNEIIEKNIKSVEPASNNDTDDIYFNINKLKELIDKLVDENKKLKEENELLIKKIEGSKKLYSEIVKYVELLNKVN